MSRRKWAMAVGTYEGTRVNTAGARDVQAASNASTVRMFAGEVNSTGDERMVIAASAPARLQAERQASPDGEAPPDRRMHTLELIGELDRISAPAVEREIERLCEEGVLGVTLDLRRLTHIDPTGISVLAFRSALCRRRGFQFALIPGPPVVQRAFALAGLLEVLPFKRAEGR